jgi:cysteine desulfurase
MTASIKDQCYLDHNATTPLCSEVVAAVPGLISAWGNSSSIHWAGRAPKNVIRDARRNIADAIGVHPLEIVFTSGGSEGNNTVIKGVASLTQMNSDTSKIRNHFMCSQVEHPSVLKSMEFLRETGFQVDFIPVNRKGEIDIDFFKSRLSPKTALVSVMFANNETGTIFPIKDLAALTHQQGALFHTDAVQALGKVKLNLNELAVDFATFSGHKFNSVKGSGFIYCKKGTWLTPLIHGGGQERNRRGGTENILGIGCLGVAAQRAKLIPQKMLKVEMVRDLFEQKILNEIKGVSVTAGESKRLPNTSSLVIHGVDGETMLMALDLKGYAVSTGAACSSGNPEPSPVLLAMGLSRAEAQNSLRVSIGWDTNLEQINAFVDELKVVVRRIRSLNQSAGDSFHV